MTCQMQWRIPIAKGPKCHKPILYGTDPTESYDISVHVAAPDEEGRLYLCAKCKTMVAICERPRVPQGFVALPIMNATY